ncbi:MAG TPA: DUF6777 domain-containing protein [Acidimicrobiales bacterium]
MQRSGLTALAALVTVATLGLAACGGDDDGGGGTADVGGERVRLEPVDAQLADPFLDTNLDTGVGAGAAGALAAALPELTESVAASLSGRVAAGSTAGLYGGSLDAEVCDSAQLVAFLTDPANAAQAEAWAGVHGIAVDEIPDYIAGLTSVRLRFDTRVTNHGFADGRAQPFQSILQAGTAVLVDDRGVPRARCYCGNPLAEPEPLPGEAGDDALDLEAWAENPEDAWEGLDPGKVVTVEPGEPSDTLTVADLETGEPVEKPVGGDAGTGPPAGPTTAPPGTAPTTAVPSTTTTTAPPSEGGSGGSGGGCTTRTTVSPEGDIRVYCD